MNSELDFIAEIGVNHEGSMQTAERLLTELANSGGKVAKFQTYKAEKLVTNKAVAYWDTDAEATTSQIELFRKYDGFEISDYEHLSKFAGRLGLEFMTTCFDLESLELLNPLLTRHKIASADITNFQLIEAISKAGKPVLLSTGAASIEEITVAVNFISRYNSCDLTLLHCVLRYPTERNLAALDRIKLLREKFPKLRVGYSDHTVPTSDYLIQISAWLLGATVIEKHFTLDKNLSGNDHYHAFDPNDVESFLDKIELVQSMRKFNENSFLKVQESARTEARRGLYFKRNLAIGEIIKADDVISLRPVGSCPSEMYFSYLGRTLKVTKSIGSQPQESDFD